MNLRDYERAKFALSEILQTLAISKAANGEPALRERLRDIFVRLSEDRFSIIIGGRFSRGKSSLLNAILGTDRLPTGLVPLTSVITTISYGTTERITLKYRGRRLDENISFDELPRYVTQRGNPANRLGIATANIELPAEILRRGVCFVDTPGLGSVIAENTVTTRSYLSEADALLLVTSFESPLSEDELDFLAAASCAGLPAFVAVNKHDLVTAVERNEAIQFVRFHLRERFGRSPEDVFSVSARDGSTARLSGTQGDLCASGLPDLEARLMRFLLEKKRTVFLAHMIARIERLLGELPSFDATADITRRIRCVSEKYGGARDSETSSPDWNTDGPFNIGQLRSCEVCSAVEDQVFTHLARYQYELTTDRDCQEDFARRSGFCCFHTREYERLASPFGTCSGYPPLLERLAVRLRDAASDLCSEPARELVKALPDRERCPICVCTDDAEASALSALTDRLRSSPKSVNRLSALCLSHLTALVAAIENPEVARSLVELHAATLERTAEDMRRFTLRQNAGQRHLHSREEQTAARRGLWLLAGAPNANFAKGHTRALGRHVGRPANEEDGS